MRKCLFLREVFAATAARYLFGFTRMSNKIAGFFSVLLISFSIVCFFQTGGGSCEWEVPSQQWHPCLSSQAPTLHPSGLGIREDTQGLWITLPILWFRTRSHVSEVQRFRCILTSISVMKCDLALRFNLQHYLWWKMPIIIIMKCLSNSSLSGAIKNYRNHNKRNNNRYRNANHRSASSSVF